MADEIFDLTPEQQAQAEQLSEVGIDLSPEQESQARKLSGQLDPLLDFTPDQLSALEISDPENFNIRREFLNRSDLRGKNDVIMRAALANQKVRARYDQPAAFKEVTENLPDLLKPAAPVVEKLIAEQIPVMLRPAVRLAGAGKQLIDTAKTVTPGRATKAVLHFAGGLAKYAANSIAGAASPFVPEEAKQDYRRRAAENLAASEQQISGLASGVKSTALKAAQIIGAAKPFSEYDPTEARELFFADLDKEASREEMTRGKGAITRQIGGEVIKELEAAGKPIRPEEVASLSDPFTFYAYTKLFGAAGGLVPAEAKAAASSASRWVGEVGRDITGTALEGIGESARLLSKVTTTPAANLAKGTVDVARLFLPPAVVPPVVPRLAKLLPRVAKVIPDISEGVRSVGKQIRTGEFVSPSARLIADVAETAPTAIADIAGGAAFDIVTTAAMAEFPEEEIGGGVGIGTVFGLIGAGRHVTRRVISGQEIAPRVWGGKTQIPTSGPFKGSEFDTLHNTAYQTATPAVKQRVNAVREFLKKAAPGVDLFYVPDKAAFETGLINQGVPAADARLWADQSGLFVRDLNGKKVAFAVDIDAAPHESFHPFQDVLGETANNILNQKVKAAYTEAEFEYEGMRYASRLGWDGRGDWRDFTLDATGEGYHATIEKLSQEAANIIKLSEGKEATPAEAREQGTRMFNEAMAEATAANPDVDPNILRRSVWRGILTEAEQKDLADNYAASELAAETWDAVFKHTGPGMKDPKGLIPRFARLAGTLVAAMEGEPLAGRVSEIGELPLRRKAVEAVREAVRGRVETPPLIGGKPVVTPTLAATRPGAPVGTPEQEAVNTTDVAASASEQPTGPEVDAQSPREILGTFAESKATSQGVKITRRTAPGTPAGAIEVSRGRRREQIETARGIPDDQKPLWEKNFTPVKTVVLNDGSFQEQGWSPEVLAANAEKTAKFLSDANRLELSPFEIDAAQKTFTADGWRNLFDKVNIFAANQAAGLTGKGTPLVIGRAREFGFFEPTGTREAAGTLTDAEANFINYLFGFPLPGKGPVLKRGGKAQYGEQLISQATEPGRAQPLVEPRTFGSKQAEQLGFAGEQLLEVNPLRAQIEQAGANPPSLIEAWQNLNLRDIVRADIAPELPAVRPVGVTLRAGFQPRPNDEMAIRSAAVRDETTGRIYEAGIHAIAREDAESRGAKGPFTDGYVTNRKIPGNKLEFLNRDEASARAEEIGQMSSAALQGAGGLESSRFELTRKFNPKQLVTPENEKRFAESVVRFADGTLKPVFHATVADFTPEQINTDAFQAHFGAPAAAADRVLGDPNTRNTAARENDAGQRTLPVFLDIKNPLRLPDAGNWESAQQVSLELYKKFGRKLPTEYRETAALGKVDSLTSEYYDEARGMDEQAAYAKANLEVLNEMKQWVEEQGYDGIVYKNEFEKAPVILREEFGSEIESEYGTDSFIAFSNDQVHSALKFSPGKRKEIELEGPDGKKYKATFDGYWDWTSVGRGHIPSFTALEDMPGAFAKNGTGMGPSFEKAGYKLPTDLPAAPEAGEAKFAPPKKDEPRVGLEFKKFFSDVTKGNFGKSDKPFEPIVDLSGAENIIESKSNHSGNFDDHIAKSIPTFYETQIKKAKAIADVYGDEGARVLDIAASEGSFGKSISESTGGKVETVSLDPNPDMAAFFESKSKVPGATYAQEAFLHGFEDAGKEYPAHDPAQPYDVITESMGFQFIDADRAPQIAEVKRLLKSDGVFLTEQKVRNTDWAANETKKDLEFKSKYFSDAELKQKDTRVGFAQSKTEAKAVGMIDNMADQVALEKILTDNFGHVVQYWDSGNFKGYAAGDNAAKVNEVVQAMGNTSSDFSTVSLPREVNLATPEKAAENILSDAVVKFAAKKKEKRDEPIPTKLVHYSDFGADLDTIDPKFMRAVNAKWGQDTQKSFWFVKGTESGKAQENFKDRFIYEADVSDQKIYDATGADPLGFFKKYGDNWEAMDNKVIDAGYGGVRVKTNDGRQVVILYNETPATHVGQTDKFGNFHAAETPGATIEFGTREDIQQPAVRWKKKIYTQQQLDAAGSHLAQSLEKLGVLSIKDWTDDGYPIEKGFVSKTGKFISEDESVVAFAPGKGIIGRVNEDGEITSKKGNLGLMSHNSLTGSGEAWRYVQDTGEVFWWFNKPDAKTQDIVTSWLESKGNKVSSHKVLGEGTPEQDFSRSHGRFSPKKEQFEDPETIREALASPGWAIITGTQEKIAGKAVPWDDPRNIAANARLKAELKAKGLETIVVEGKYKGKSQGENYLVLDLTPEGAHALGQKYNQESIITNEGLLYGDGSRVPAVPEKTLIGPGAEQQLFYSVTPEGTAFSIGLDFDKPWKPVGEQQELFGKTSEAKDFSRRIRARIADKKERFPESAPLGYEKNADGSFRINAKTGKPVPEKQDHNFLDSGLAKESGKGLRGEAREAAYVKAAGDAMAEEYKKAVKNPEVAAGAKWYSTLRTRLRKLFGDQSQLVCEVLAATSARTPVETNYRFGIDAVNKFNAGDYDAQIAKYQEGLDNWDAGNINDYVTATGRDNPKRATFLDWWIDTHALKPRQSNGKLFAANSKAVLRALHGSWEGGKKTRQFSQNMSGADFGATVDVWAARTLHRISNENRVARWRILAEHENAVQDNDFDVAQKVFKHAADKAGIKPDALQGVLWFREKDLWEKRGWTRGSGAEKSDFSSLIAETEKTPTGQYKIKSPQGDFQFSPKKKLGECVGNCINAKIVEDIFGSVSEFAGQVEEHGDNFSYRGVQVVYDPKKDIHTFYKDAYVQPRPSKLVADQIKAQVDESRAWTRDLTDARQRALVDSLRTRPTRK